MQQAPGPDARKVPVKDVLGVTVVLLSAMYHAREFIRIGYYVNNHYRDEALNECPPPVSEATPIDTSLVERTLREDKPRITLFSIDWDHPDAPLEMPPLPLDAAQGVTDAEEIDDDDEDDEEDEDDDEDDDDDSEDEDDEDDDEDSEESDR